MKLGRFCCLIIACLACLVGAPPKKKDKKKHLAAAAVREAKAHMVALCGLDFYYDGLVRAGRLSSCSDAISDAAKRLVVGIFLQEYKAQQTKSLSKLFDALVSRGARCNSSMMHDRSKVFGLFGDLCQALKGLKAFYRDQLCITGAPLEDINKAIDWLGVLDRGTKSKEFNLTRTSGCEFLSRFVNTLGLVHLWSSSSCFKDDCLGLQFNDLDKDIKDIIQKMSALVARCEDGAEITLISIFSSDGKDLAIPRDAFKVREAGSGPIDKTVLDGFTQKCWRSLQAANASQVSDLLFEKIRDDFGMLVVSSYGIEKYRGPLSVWFSVLLNEVSCRFDAGSGSSFLTDLSALSDTIASCGETRTDVSPGLLPSLALRFIALGDPQCALLLALSFLKIFKDKFEISDLSIIQLLAIWESYCASERLSFSDFTLCAPFFDGMAGRGVGSSDEGSLRPGQLRRQPQVGGGAPDSYDSHGADEKDVKWVRLPESCLACQSEFLSYPNKVVFNALLDVFCAEYAKVKDAGKEKDLEGIVLCTWLAYMRAPFTVSGPFFSKEDRDVCVGDKLFSLFGVGDIEAFDKKMFDYLDSGIPFASCVGNNCSSIRADVGPELSGLQYCSEACKSTSTIPCSASDDAAKRVRSPKKKKLLVS